MAGSQTISLLETMRKYWLGILAASVLGAFYFLHLYYSQTGFYPTMPNDLPYLVISILTANIIAYIVYVSDKFLNNFINWNRNTSLRLLTGILVNTLIATIIAYTVSYITIVSTSKITTEEIFVIYKEPAIKIAILVLISIIIYSIISFALFSYNQYAVVQIEMVKHERKQIKLQFEALKSQLSPHYLFNCLNTVSSLVYKDPDLAENFIRRLAQTYQYVLNTNKRKLVTLKEELEFVKSYYYLLKVRFENSFDLNIDIPSHIMTSSLPPLTLQILVENAVKHNVFSKDEPLEVFIEEENNQYLKVTNTKSERPASVSSFRVGLNNIKKRYEFFTDKKIKVEDEQDFTVKLPILKELVIENGKLSQVA